jgi:hypothetical protein
MRMAIVAVAVLGLAGAADAAPRRVETISYETSPCFGTCPVYKVTVSSNGRGVFEGRRFTAVAGTRAFRVTPVQFRSFRQRLAADRPVGEVTLDGERCARQASDLPGVTVRWTGGVRSGVLRANYGCDPDRNARLFRALRAAPDALPIRALIVPRVPFPPGR